ncbi:hypothetical protein O6H91_19G069800 [Diphasiastrum complanatum]|uniref:Uncharacterized protein n=2 Tax=Diphasiastrum complanatum TaxID=34168 RepID=A0ACC2AW92_DIPCM|nr:hypothetical protein O6H91_19G068100 [Diphasiastrum complanatum]KAJ7521833.1 hypothetical protein O6H91_19G069800 [Diphasiastrum complanatum]
MRPQQTSCLILVAATATILSYLVGCSKAQEVEQKLVPPTTSAGFNASLAARLDKEFTTWISGFRHLKHSVSKIASTKLTPCKVITVDKRGGFGTVQTVQAAVDAVMNFNFQRVIIMIHAGIYREKVIVPKLKPFITFQGEGSQYTIIEWDDTASKLGPGGQPLGTYNSATVAIDSPYFTAKNITFSNIAPAPPPGAEGQQAVALRISGDTAAFYGCQFLGAQDTLYDHEGRHFFRDCYVEGSVDFIFGDGLSMYYNCQLHAISKTIYGAVTAQQRGGLFDDTGFSFVNCQVTGSGALYLGRAWGTFSRVVYAYTYMDPIIIPEGWYNWGDPAREQTVFYGLYNCYGPGANYQGRVAWSRELTSLEAQPFLTLSFIDGEEWLQF